MSIRLSLLPFDGAVVGCPEESYRSHATVLHRLIETIVKEMLSHPALKQVDYLGHRIFENPEQAPSPPSEPVELEVVLVDNLEVLNYWGADPDVLGFHAVASGAFEEVDNGDVMAWRHRVVVVVDESACRSLLASERRQDEAFGVTHDALGSLASYLVTVTHEIAHAVEWIAWTNGLSPAEVNNLRACGKVDLDHVDISSGHGIIFDFDPKLGNQQLRQLMEERVEAKGRQWLSSLSLPHGLLSEALALYSGDDN